MSLRFACRACESNGNCAVICRRSYAPWRPTTQAYPSEERAAGRSPVRSTANQAAKQHRGAWCFTTQRLVLAIRMCSMREQWNVHRHACPSGYMSQELCSVATNDADLSQRAFCSTPFVWTTPEFQPLESGVFVVCQAWCKSCG